MMPDTLPLRLSAADLADPLPPILVDARQAAALLGIGLRTLRALDSAGRMPSPVRLSPGCVRWRLDELSAWTAAGAPDRETWEARRRASQK